jgi:endo-1,4-beta-xylanase
MIVSLKPLTMLLLLLLLCPILPGCIESNDNLKTSEYRNSTLIPDSGPILSTPQSLRYFANLRGINIGAAVAVGPLRSDKLYSEILKREFNMLTPENALKFEAIHPAHERYEFLDAETIIDFAETNNMAVRGHTLIWHRGLPAWIEKGKFSSSELTSILKEHIFTVVGHFRGRIAAWDVVNEAFNDDGSFKDTIWFRNIGSDYIALAFQWAHEADPEALLFYNDYGSEGLNPKSNAIYNLVSNLKQRNVPIHGVGFQTHITPNYSLKIIEMGANMNRFFKLGLQTDITELEIRIKDPPTEEQLESQAQTYSNILKMFLAAGNGKAFVLWGFHDPHSWIPAFFHGYGSALIFDDAYKPKPGYYALLNTLKGD